ncbi:protein argonaute 2 isoform X2 [Cryptomeria japonica]|uniref:protein argonaute 2 isoform X2 n=1 Tax=Cryptomeria japonica TaxID=3369 RepID=UPI0027DAA64B|nr:protein argonaute 2 isoform X2 [Cryptomeria japonica]
MSSWCYQPPGMDGWGCLPQEEDEAGWQWGRGGRASPRGRGGRGSLSWGRGRSERGEDGGGWGPGRGGRGPGRGSLSWGRGGRGSRSSGRRGRSYGRGSPKRKDEGGWESRPWRSSGWGSPLREDGGGCLGTSGWGEDGGGCLGTSGWECGRSGWGSPPREDGGGCLGTSGWNPLRELDLGFVEEDDEGGEERESPPTGTNEGVLLREDEGGSESVAPEEDEYDSSEHDDVAMSSPSGRNSVGRNPKENIQSLQSSLKSGIDEYFKKFQDMEAELIRVKADKEELSEIKRKTEAELIRVKADKEELGEIKRKTEAVLIIAKRDIKELAERNKKLEEELKRVKEGEESIKKLEEQLKRAKEGEESSRQNLEQTRNKLRELSTTFGAMKEECDKVCDQQGAAPQLKKRKYVLKVFEVNDLLNCPICWEPWSQSGEHNACSLSCGHFFGKSCITRWISSDGNRSFSSPQSKNAEAMDQLLEIKQQALRFQFDNNICQCKVV